MMVKKTFFMMFACVVISIFMTGCGAGVDATVDPKVLENKDEVQKIYDVISKVMGSQISKANEISIRVDNPADKGESGNCYLYITIDMQDPSKPKQLVRQLFHGELGGWQATQEVTVQARGDAEDFRLEDELFDFSKIDADKLYYIIQTAYNKDNENPQKFTYRYVSSVNIDVTGIRVDVEGKLEVNDQMISDYVNFDLDGNLVE
jgi:DNA-binding protein YbaB